jgi:hypothetical protein
LIQDGAFVVGSTRECPPGTGAAGRPDIPLHPYVAAHLDVALLLRKGKLPQSLLLRKGKLPQSLLLKERETLAEQRYPAEQRWAESWGSRTRSRNRRRSRNGRMTV